MSIHVLCSFSVDYREIFTERCYLDRNNLHPHNPIWYFCITQTDSNIDHQDCTEFWYATFYRAIVSIMAQVLLQSFQVETESTKHLVNNNQAGTPWRNQSTQAFEWNSLLGSEELLFLLLSNSRILISPWPTIIKGSGRGGRSNNRHSLLWWSSPPRNPIYIFHGNPAGAS